MAMTSVVERMCLVDPVRDRPFEEELVLSSRSRTLTTRSLDSPSPLPTPRPPPRRRNVFNIYSYHIKAKGEIIFSLEKRGRRSTLLPAAGGLG